MVAPGYDYFECRVKVLEIGVSVMAKRIRSGDVLLEAERTKRNARAESFGGARSVYPTPRANAQIAAVGQALPERMAEVGAGGELVPFDNAGLVSAFRDTLVHPDSVIKDASHDRLELLKKAGVVEMGLDASATTNAANSVEKMLSHELAAAHAAVMKMFGQVREAQAAMPDACERAVLSGDYGSLNKEICRTGGAIARLMLAMQQGALTLQRLRLGARQTVRVEYVQLTQIAPGGQAVVAGRIKRGSGENRGGRKNGG
jgi:hypothetical protein